MGVRATHPHVTRDAKTGKVRQMNLGVPQKMAHVIPPDATFAPEFVEAGILFRFAGFAPRNQPRPKEAALDVPTWARNGDAS